MGRRPPPPDSTCYACDELAATWEHAPPRTLYPVAGEFRFPVRKDFRAGLIQVPSCAAHNNGKHRDDAYVVSYLVVISASRAGVLRPPLEPFVERHLENIRRGRRLSKTFSGNPLVVSTVKGDFSIIEPEADTIDRVVTHMAKALYHHHGFRRTGSWETASKWAGSPRVRDMPVVGPDGRPPQDQETFLHLARSFEALRDGGYKDADYHGPHPEAFHYQLIEPNGEPLAMRLVFYKAYQFIVLAERPA